MAFYDKSHPRCRARPEKRQERADTAIDVQLLGMTGYRANQAGLGVNPVKDVADSALYDFDAR